jgi:hypothetical protein
MAKKKKYRIYCQNCAASVSGDTVLDTPPDTCPVNAAHTIDATSKCVTEDYALDNLAADRAPTVNDDVNAGYVVNSRWIWGTLEWICTDNTSGAAVWTPVLTGVFGTQYNYAESLDDSTTTSTSMQQKLRLTVSVPAGVYRVGWSYGLTTSAANKLVKSQIQVDDTTTLATPAQYPANTGVSAPCPGFAQVTLTAGSHNIDIDWCIDNSGTAIIRYARLELWRVG